MLPALEQAEAKARAIDWAIKAVDHRYWIALLGSRAFQDVLRQAPNWRVLLGTMNLDH